MPAAGSTTSRAASSKAASVVSCARYASQRWHAQQQPGLWLLGSRSAAGSTTCRAASGKVACAASLPS